MRQNIRKAIIFISFLFFPITIYYFSPALIIMGAGQGIIAGSFVIFLLMFMGSLFFGRAFCGWLCPAGGLQDYCSVVVGKKARGGRFNWIKFFIWVPWIGIIIFAALSAGGLKTVDFFYQTDHGISIANINAYIIYYFFVGLIVLLAFIAGKRAFCHYVCWMSPFMMIGNKIKNLVGLPALNLTVNTDKCNGCKSCNKNCPMSIEVSEMVQRGALEDSECIRCGECVDGCPRGVIKYSLRPQK